MLVPCGPSFFVRQKPSVFRSTEVSALFPPSLFLHFFLEFSNIPQSEIYQVFGTCHVPVYMYVPLLYADVSCRYIELHSFSRKKKVFPWPFYFIFSDTHNLLFLVEIYLRIMIKSRGPCARAITAPTCARRSALRLLSALPAYWGCTAILSVQQGTHHCLLTSCGFSLSYGKLST